MMLAAWLIFPLILLALCTGVGLLVDAASGRRLPGPLVPVAGLAGIIVIASFTTMSSFTAPMTMPLVVLCALVGAVLSRRWRFGRIDRWAVGVAVAVFLVYGAPVIASGEPTFAGYVKLDDTATWIAITDRVMEHGRSMEGLEPSTYERTLAVYSGDGYPVGANLPWGVAGKLSWVDTAWTFQPYMAFLAAMLSLVLLTLARAVIARPWLTALVAFIGAQPALLYGFSLWGGVKEVLAAVLIGLAACTLPAAVRQLRDGSPDADAPGGGPRDDPPGASSPSEPAPDDPPGANSPSEPPPDDAATPRRTAAAAPLPLVISLAALAATLSFGGMVWVAPLLLGGAVWAVAELGPRAAAVRALWLVVLGAILTIPVIATGRLTPPVENPVTSDAVLNLLQPLHAFQVFGIWPTEDFRLRPDAIGPARALAILAALAAVAGLVHVVRRRAWGPAGFIVTSGLACAVFALAASPWVLSKAMATASAAVLFAAILGAAALFELSRRSTLDIKIAAAALLAALSAGTLWSNALAYTDPSLAPYEQFAELEEIGEVFAGEGPTLMTEYNPYGARHFLREMDPEGAAELRHRPVPKRDGTTPEKGEDVDLDELDGDALLVYKTIVIRNLPDQSRPPAHYELAARGRHYEVWQRPEEPNMVILNHMAVGEDGHAAALPDCSQVRGLGLLPMVQGIQGAYLIAAPPRRTDDLVTLPLESAPDLCGQRWDWIATALDFG